VYSLGSRLSVTFFTVIGSSSAIRTVFILKPDRPESSPALPILTVTGVKMFPPA
jgi:hypothetical protein